MPPWWSALPFAGLLLAIAVIPLVAPHWWHRWYPVLALALGGVTAIGCWWGGLGAGVVHAAEEYASFITVIGGLYLVTAGITLRLNVRATATSNALLLLGGGVLSNVIGTTGASLLLIRPFLDLNRGRLAPYHVVFFILIVSNVGGALTPVGDPPLLMGYLRGIGFWDFLILNGPAWLIAMGLLLAGFWMLDRTRAPGPAAGPGRALHLEGWPSLALLPAAAAAILIDPQRLPWMREVTLAALAGTGWVLARRRGKPDLGPLMEVAVLFVGIFLTMVPALALIRGAAASGNLPTAPLPLFLLTGLGSAVLDNAPTFVAMASSLEGATGLDLATLAAHPTWARSVAACAVASVFCGALTYIGNGPNLMVAAIAGHYRDRNGNPVVPSFGAYALRFAIPLLVPILAVIALALFA